MSNAQLTRSKVIRETALSVVSPDISASLRFSVYVIVVYTLSLALPEIGFGTELVRAASGFVLLSFVPGLLLLRTRITQFRSIDLLYAVALSVVASTFITWGANALYRAITLFPRPFVENRLVVVYLLSISGLVIGSWYSTRERTAEEEFPILGRNYDPRILVSVLTLPVFGSSGALILNGTGENVVILSVLAISAVLPLITLVFDDEDRYLGVVLLSISFALIMQRALIATHLAFGDGVRAYSTTLTVLDDGYWIPNGTLEAMPRIAPLQAAYTLVMDIPLLWVFKLAHPLVFALTPVIGYVLATRYFSQRVAFLGMVLYVFLPETYRLLPRNTRTGAAIFFAVVLVAVMLDDGLGKRERIFLGLAVFWAMIGSHYGLGPLFLLLLVPGFILYRALVRLGSERRPMIGSLSLCLFGLITFMWYLYQSRDTFQFVAINIVNRAINFATPTSNTAATNAVSFGYPSLSYEFLFYSHLLIAALACASIGTVLLVHVLDIRTWGHPAVISIRDHALVVALRDWIERDASDALRDAAYLSTMFGIVTLLPLSFGPNILSSARTFGLEIVFLGPFVILAMRLPKYTRFRFAPAGVFLVAILLITSGFVSATVTHDASRVPNFDRERIVDSGDRIEQFALYRVYNPQSSVSASGFIATYVPADKTVDESLLSSYASEFSAPNEENPRRVAIRDPQQLQGEYVYIGEADTVTNTITTEFQGFVYYDYVELPSFSERNQVYSNGKSKIIN